MRDPPLPNDGRGPLGEDVIEAHPEGGVEERGGRLGLVVAESGGRRGCLGIGGGGGGGGGAGVGRGGAEESGEGGEMVGEWGGRGVLLESRYACHAC